MGYTEDDNIDNANASEVTHEEKLEMASRFLGYANEISTSMIHRQVGETPHVLTQLVKGVSVEENGITLHFVVAMKTGYVSCNDGGQEGTYTEYITL